MIQMVANAGIAIVKPLVDRKISISCPSSFKGHLIYLFKSLCGGIRQSHLCQPPRRHALLQICCHSNDQTGRGEEELSVSKRSVVK